MRSRFAPTNKRRLAAGVAAAATLVAGCAHIPNLLREDGPSADAELDSPSARSIYAACRPAEPRTRGWPPLRAASPDGAVIHWPLYMEDPFADKGHGRQGRNVYYIGWEDYVALAYCYPRYTLNWLLLPVSAVVTPPWTVMESDGRISRQLLGYDHDAAPVAAAGRVDQPEAETPESGQPASVEVEIDP